jgi:hypothetical protein
MKASITIIIMLLLVGPADAAQTRRKPRPRAPQKTETRPPGPRIVGSQVLLITKNGDRITGVILDLTAYSVRIRANNLESVHALDTLASISFGTAAPPVQRPELPPVRPEFSRDFNRAIEALQSMVSQTNAGTNYTDYGRQLTGLRRDIDQFIGMYSSSDNSLETRIVALLAGAVTDYNWARTVWNLKLGRTSDGTVNESEVTDLLSLYPDLREAASSGGKLSGDKMIASLWRKAAAKADRARSLVAQPRGD